MVQSVAKNSFRIAILAVTLIPSSLFAQRTSSSENSPQTPTPLLPNNAGGGANADFGSLITLIQDVIPGEWDTDDTITPFASGVWIDPNGMMHRVNREQAKQVRFKATDKTQDVLNQTLGSVQEKADLRWVSLSEIDRLLKQKESRTVLSKPAGLMLGGLARIDYLHWDSQSKEWYLGGPAGGFELNEDGELLHHELHLPPIRLEDLLTLAPVVMSRSGAFGCTIDPSEAGLAQANQLLQDPSSIALLKSKPMVFAEKLGQAVGPQKLSMINLPEGCSTGLALLLADEHMKRVGLEQANEKTDVTSYWQAVEKQKNVQPNSMVRWWFALQEQPIALMNGSMPGCIDYVFDRSTVRVLSQAEWMQANGKRVAQQQQDPAADAFAASFTEKFPELQTQVSVYARLRHIFDLAVAIEAIRREAESDPAKSLSNLAAYDLSSQQGQPFGSIDSLVAVRKIKNKSISAVVSGGVLIELSGSNLRRTTSIQSSNEAFDTTQFYSLAP